METKILRVNGAGDIKEITTAANILKQDGIVAIILHPI